jgi:predicted enzyme related to lactoylglutathione lyase
MTTAITTRLHRPAWVDLATPDAAASRDFYSKLFGWQVSVNPDPQYGGYAIAQIGDEQVGGIGPTQSPQQPTAWSLYIGTDDVDALAARVPGLGGTVLAPPFDVGDQGRMATFADPSGAVISAWQAGAMRPWRADWSNTYGWAELTTRGLRAGARARREGDLRPVRLLRRTLRDRPGPAGRELRHRQEPGLAPDLRPRRARHDPPQHAMMLGA